MSNLVATSAGEGLSAPEFLTPQQVADKLQVSTDTAIRLFTDVKGVIDIGSPEDTRKHKRRYRVLRIPTAVWNRWCHERGVS